MIVAFSDTWTVNASVSGGNGSAAPDTQEITPSQDASISLTPAAHYHIGTIR